MVQSRGEPASATLRVDATLRIPLRELVWRFDPSGGPGGQHANKTSTRAEVRWNVETSSALTDAQRERLRARLGGEVRIAADDARSQLRNRTIALERLAEKVADALRREVPRRPTKPTKGSQRRRLEAKKQRSQIKQGRAKQGRGRGGSHGGDD